MTPVLQNYCRFPQASGGGPVMLTQIFFDFNRVASDSRYGSAICPEIPALAAS
jgi:hypothetical protein